MRLLVTFYFDEPTWECTVAETTAGQLSWLFCRQFLAWRTSEAWTTRMPTMVCSMGNDDRRSHGHVYPCLFPDGVGVMLNETLMLVFGTGRHP